ncbi:MAG: SDR family NAD(P)-dependent oxidoreductase [Candidatus Glassbacteria bacterium]|nr:SDR family NAD(P)-dependent oxidoreductase [Candidatus Glassbacteria bacterium]
MGYGLKKYGAWALVTGASAGFGWHFASYIAAEGVNVAVVARRRDRLVDLSAGLEKDHGVETLVIEQDLSRPESTANVYAAFGDRELGLLVLNAGFGYHGEFVKQSEEQIATMISLNCTSYTTLFRRFVPQMVERGRGAMILVSSVLGYFPGPWNATYTATKAFDLALGESIREELNGTGVDLLNLCPGMTDTDFHAVANEEGRRRKLAPERKMDSPEEIVELALRNLGRKGTVYPMQGLPAALVSRLLPRGWAARIAGKVMEMDD